MDFKNKMKKRLYMSVILVLIGVLMAAVPFISKSENTFISSYGAALAACGAVKISQYCKTMKSEESMRKREIMENDERNISIANRAKSMTFSFYVILCGIAIIVLGFMGRYDSAQMISLSVCALLAIYLCSYFYISKRS